MKAGENWEDWKDSLHYFDYVVAASIVIGAVYLFFRWRRSGGPPGDAADASDEVGGPAADAPAA